MKHSDLPNQLWAGDHVQINGENMMFDEYKETYHHPDGAVLEGFIRVFKDSGSAMIMLRKIETFEPVVIPELRFTDQPKRGDWFWRWHTTAEPYMSMFWDIVGPFGNGTHTLRVINKYDVARYVTGKRRTLRSPGWVNDVLKDDGQLTLRGIPIPFFDLPFVPACLRLGSRDLVHQPRLF